MKNKEVAYTKEDNKIDRDSRKQIESTIAFTKQRIQDLYTCMAMATSDNERTYINIQIRDDEKYLRDIQNGK